VSKQLNVVFITGPTYAGKSTLVRLIAKQLCSAPPHYIRLVAVDVDGGPRLTILGDLKEAGLASWNRINYDADRVFEFLPECLEKVSQLGGSGNVLIEADCDPSLRYAYPYDTRLFVMPSPTHIDEVFRSPNEAADALREVMDDTAAFATEIFGLFDPDDNDDSDVNYHRGQDRGVIAEERVEITPLQMRRFMCSPLGAEIASRIQLQPAYHGLMESDVILVNQAVGSTHGPVESTISQIQTLISRLHTGRIARPVLYYCDPLDAADSLQYRLLQHLREILLKD